MAIQRPFSCRVRFTPPDVSCTIWVDLKDGPVQVNLFSVTSGSPW